MDIVQSDNRIVTQCHLHHFANKDKTSMKSYYFKSFQTEDSSATLTLTLFQPILPSKGLLSYNSQQFISR